jgi:triosephosphate isomerase
MNPTTLEEAKALAKATADATTSETTAEIIVCVPHVFLVTCLFLLQCIILQGTTLYIYTCEPILHFQESVKRELGDSRVKMAAQSIFFEDKGAFTGSD